MTVEPAMSDESLLRSLLLVHRFSDEITEIAVGTLGAEAASNREIAVLVHLARHGAMNPTTLGAALGAPRTSLTRSLQRIADAGLVRRARDPRDGRGVLMTLTARGRRRLSAFGARLTDHLRQGCPPLKEALELVGMSPAGAADIDPLAVAASFSATGDAYVADVDRATQTFGSPGGPERHALAMLALYGKVRPGWLGAELGLTPSGTSGLLTRLEEYGLIERRHDETEDRRAVGVRLLPAGEAAVAAMLGVYRAHLPSLASVLAASQ